MTHKEFEVHYLKNKNLVRQLVIGYEEDAGYAEQLEQDVWLRAWEKIDQFEGRANFGTWLHTVASSVCKNYLRDDVAQRPDVTTEVDLPSHISEDGVQESWIEANHSHEDTPAAHAEADDLEQYYDGMTVQQRQIVDALEKGLSYEQVALECKTTLGNVYYQINAIKKALGY